jgi:hypothetical protein
VQVTGRPALLRMRIAWAAVVLFSCAAPRPLVIVRMATRGEVLPDPAPPEFTDDFRAQCAVTGPPARDYVRPVLEFAKTYLLEGFETARPVREYWAMPGRPEPPDRNGVDIIVDPRATRGVLLTRIRRGSWFAGTGYCLHVQPGPEGTTIVIERSWEWIH